jgi:hypothetical protein
VTRTDVPTLRDFRSNTAKGRQPPAYDSETLRLWAGLSVFDTLERARERAQHLPALGRFIATIQLPLDGSVHYEQTGNDRHHFTLWADPLVLLRSVIAVEPVRR